MQFPPSFGCLVSILVELTQDLVYRDSELCKGTVTVHFLWNKIVLEFEGGCPMNRNLIWKNTPHDLRPLGTSSEQNQRVQEGRSQLCIAQAVIDLSPHGEQDFGNTTSSVSFQQLGAIGRFEPTLRWQKWVGLKWIGKDLEKCSLLKESWKCGLW